MGLNTLNWMKDKLARALAAVRNRTKSQEGWSRSHKLHYVKSPVTARPSGVEHSLRKGEVGTPESAPFPREGSEIPLSWFLH
jgi:hypothetical protein